MKRVLCPCLLAAAVACTPQPNTSAPTGNTQPTQPLPSGSAHGARTGNTHAQGPAHNPAGTQPGTPADNPPQQAPGTQGGTLAPSNPTVTSVPRVMRYPTRVAVAPDGAVLVTDALAGAVFVLDEHLAPVMDLGGFGRPLGIAVDAQHIFVGDAASHQVRVFTRAGVPVRTVDDAMEMPNALALDAAGRLYVADSRSHVVLVYDGQGHRLNTLRQAGAGSALNFPSSLVVGGAPGEEPELYVGDQGNARVVVFALDGTFRRTLGQRAQAFAGARDGRFVRIQGLALDGVGNLHVADAYLAEVQVLDARTGAFLRRYQADTPQAMPLDLAFTPRGQVVFTDGVHNSVGLMSQATASTGGQP